MAFTQSGTRGPWSSPNVARKNLVLAIVLVTLFGLSINFLYHEPASRNLLQQTGKAALSPFGKRNNLVDIQNATLGVGVTSRQPKSLSAHSVSI